MKIITPKCDHPRLNITPDLSSNPWPGVGNIKVIPRICSNGKQFSSSSSSSPVVTKHSEKMKSVDNQVCNLSTSSISKNHLEMQSDELPEGMAEVMKRLPRASNISCVGYNKSMHYYDKVCA